MPSMKVVTQLLVGLVTAVVIRLAQDQSWIDTLPVGAAAWAPIVIGAIAAYFKAETNPAPSSFNQPQ